MVGGSEGARGALDRLGGDRVRGATPAEWQDWRWQLRSQLRTAADLEAWITLTPAERRGLEATKDRFRFGVTPYYASLMHPTDAACPIRRQAIPSVDELEVGPLESADPLAEERDMPVPGLTRRYPDRVLLYTSHTCAVYCRHCTRRRKVARADSAPSGGQLDRALAWIADHPEVRDVVLSGGDPLSLGDAVLDRLLGRLLAIPHVELVRIGTRHPTSLPQRIDAGLVDVLRRHRPVFVMTHFNHPRELTDVATSALGALADAGVVLSNQAVLLRGINDDVEVMRALCQGLLARRVRPYRLFHCDYTAGTGHLRTRLADDLALMAQLAGHTSGLAVPELVVDLPGGGGKSSPARGWRRDADGRWILRSYRGDEVVLPPGA